MPDLDSIKYSFKNKDLFDQALTHRSWLNEHKGARESNERLEFLGDAILEYIVSKDIYDRFPNREEGYLTSLRANLVNTVSLANLAKRLGLGLLLFLSKGEEESGGRDNESLLADTLEAVIGAIFIDSGIRAAQDFIEKYLLNDIEARAQSPLKDAKSRLQEYVQSKGYSAPKYRVLSASGPDHNKKFSVEVAINGEAWGRGEGKSKNTAQQEAARQALAQKVK
jgi:ribonuclease-3